MAAPMVFKGPCPACGEERKLIEFKAVPCTPGPEPLSDADPPAASVAPNASTLVWRGGEYGFRCLSCKTIFPEAHDATGKAHRWVDGHHVELAA